MDHRRLTGALLLAGTLGLLVSSGAAAAGFGAPILDQTEPVGAASQLTDLGGSGKQVGLGVQRSGESVGSNAGVLYRQADAEPFLGPGFTDGDHARVAVCPGGPIQVLDVDDSGHRAVLLANLTTFTAISQTGQTSPSRRSRAWMPRTSRSRCWSPTTPGRTRGCSWWTPRPSS